MRYARISALAVLLLTVPPGAAAMPQRPQDPSQIPVSLNFVDQPVARVLFALFAAGGVRGDVDPCVTGRVSVTLQNVTLGMALDAVARMADLDVRRVEGPATFRVSCRDVAARRARTRAALAGAPSVTMTFRIDRVEADGRSETRAEPRLVVPVGEVAELSETSEVPDYALADDGEILIRSRRPSWSLRVAVAAPRTGGTPELRGILEISSESSRDPEPAVVTATQPFRGVLADDAEVRLASVELGGATWILTLTRVE